MNIQSLSIVVPTKNKCVNKCKFCVSRTHSNPYIDKISNCLLTDDIVDKYSIEYKDYFNRLQFARDNGCNVVILTGTGEPTQNFPFLKFFFEINSKLITPFKSIEIQSTGVLLNDEKLKLLRELGVTTISLSISNIFDNNKNLEIIGCHKKLRFDIEEIISLIEKHDFNLRLSLNLVKDFDDYSVENVLSRCKELGADQITFRKLYKSETNTEIDEWIDKNSSVSFYDEIVDYIINKGIYLGKLPFGANIYNVDEMSVVVDSNCMAEIEKESDMGTYKYLILRENSRLYFRWETKSALVY